MALQTKLFSLLFSDNTSCCSVVSQYSMKTVRVSISQGPVQRVLLQMLFLNTLTATLISAVVQVQDGKDINFIPSGRLTMGKHKALQPAVKCMHRQQ